MPIERNPQDNANVCTYLMVGNGQVVHIGGKPKIENVRKDSSPEVFLKVHVVVTDLN